MARKKKGELPSGSIRRKVFIGYEYLVDEKGNPILDEKGKQKKRAKYKSITASSIKEAEQLKAEVKASKVKYTKNSEMTLREAITKYISQSDALLSPSTIRSYETILRNGFQHIMDVKLGCLTEEFMRDAINTECKRESKGNKKGTISSKTVVNEYGLISAVLNLYMPALEIKAELPQLESHQNDISTADVIFDLFKGDIIELPVLLAMWMSFTMSEIQGLTKSGSISRDGNYITIKEVMVRDRDNQYVIKRKGKQPTRERTLRLPEYIKNLIADVPEDKLVILSPTVIYKRFVRKIEDAGLPHMTFHDLRHVNASVMSKVNIPKKQAQARGGWKSSKIMETVYTQAFSAERSMADDLIDDYFNKIIHKKDKIDEKKYNAWLILYDKKDNDKSRNEFKAFICE